MFEGESKRKARPGWGFDQASSLSVVKHYPPCLAEMLSFAAHARRITLLKYLRDQEIEVVHTVWGQDTRDLMQKKGWLAGPVPAYVKTRVFVEEATSLYGELQML